MPVAHDVFLPIVREWAARTETGDRAELEDLPEDLPFWNEVSATAETCLGTDCPQLRRVLRHAHAAARRGVRRRDRQSSPAVRRRGGPAERLRRGDSGLQPRSSSTKRTSSRTWRRSTSASRQQLPHRGPRARRRAARVDRRTDRRPRERDRQGGRALRDHARAFFTELAFAHRGRRTVEERRAGARDRGVARRRRTRRRAPS